MDFHSLSRRELQALCKRNKIPANITNIGMADALSALELVEGMDDFMEQSQTETAQSSIDSPVRSDATSLRVPPTGGRTTRRKTVAKGGEPETANPMTRTRRTARKTLAKDTDESQSDVSSCLKIESQLKECVDEEKKEALMTPAPSAATSRRRRAVKEETAVPIVYSTRRSTRLATKTESKQSGLFKNDMPTNSGESVKNLKDDMDEISIISDSNTVMNEESADVKDDSEHISAPQQEMPIGDGIEVVVDTIEENNFEADASKQEVKESTDVEFEKAELEEKCDKMEESKDEKMEVAVENTEELNIDKDEEVEMDEEKCDEVEESKDEKMEIAVQNTEELNTDKDAGHDDLETVVFETEDNKAVEEFSCEADICDETEKEMHNDNAMDSEDVTDFNVNEEVREVNTEVSVDVVEEEFTLDGGDEDKAFDSVIVEADESTDVIAADLVETVETTKADMDAHLVFKPTRSTPIKSSASEAPSATKNVTSFILSDNKENIVKETVKMAKNNDENVKLDDLSMRRLAKMLKEKLQITNNSGKIENGDEKTQVVPRPALQAIPENR